MKMKHTIKDLKENILKEDGKIIEFGYEYTNPNEMSSRPVGDWDCMLEFFSSELVCADDDERYNGNFNIRDLSGDYVRNCMKVINDVEKHVELLKNKYEKYGVKITIGDFNIGCQYGMAVYFWIPKVLKSINHDDLMNSELNKTVMEIIKIEVMELIKHYKWKWNEKDMCYYNERGDDVADCVYYDCSGFIIHPKVLATYVENYLMYNEIETLCKEKTDDLWDSIINDEEK